MSHVMNTYARQPVAFVRGEGVWLWDDAGKKYLDALAGIAVNTLGYGHPRLKKALIGQGRERHPPHLQPVAHPRPGSRRRPHRGDHRPGRGVLLQFRPRGERGGDQGRAQVRPRSRHRRAGDHRDGEGVPRPLARHAVGHRQPQGAGRLRAAGVRVRARAAQRPRGGAPGGGAQQERGGDLRRADPGRRRHQRLAPGVPARPEGDLRAQGMAVHVRRGAMRPRAHRQVVRLPARRLPARRGAARQGPRLGRAGGRLRGGRPRQGRVQARQPWLDLRRQPARDDRGGHDHRHHQGRGTAGECGAGR